MEGIKLLCSVVREAPHRQQIKLFLVFPHFSKKILCYVAQQARERESEQQVEEDEEKAKHQQT
jgi:hypothetical protein